MLEILVWGVVTTLITVGVGGAIVVVDRRRRREEAALELIEEVGDRVDALDGVEDRLDRLAERLEAAERSLLPPKRS